MIVAASRTNWGELAATSHYRTATAIADKLAEGNVDEASTGLQELIEAVARSERRALRSQLIRAMIHVLKWKTQPKRRSSGWALSIYDAREEITAIQEEVPSLTREAIEEMWEQCFAIAKRKAKVEMNQDVTVEQLSWREVFEDEYFPVEPRPSPAPRTKKANKGRRKKQS